MNDKLVFIYVCVQFSVHGENYRRVCIGLGGEWVMQVAYGGIGEGK